jgi:hypothetical protein
VPHRPQKRVNVARISNVCDYFGVMCTSFERFLIEME